MNSGQPASYYEQLLASVAGISPPTALGAKPTEMESRIHEALRLTRLLESRKDFSFIRLGDMDLGMLLALQDGISDPFGALAVSAINGTQPRGSPGIGMRHAPRMAEAFKSADYVDFHQRLWPVGDLLPRLELERRAEQHCNPDAETSYLLLTWVETEFKQYCSRHKVGFAGAESRLLECLLQDQQFLSASRNYWNPEDERYFHQIRNDGRTLDADLDQIKEDLREFVAQTGIDTLFLSLGGAAKIIGVELSRECGIRTIDFGAMLRGLTFSGSDGHAAARATHSPFYYRVPFSVYMDALECAFQELPPEALLAKSHAQLIQELQPRVIGWTSTGEGHSLSEEQAQDFHESLEIYLRRYSGMFGRNVACRTERLNFLHYCGQRNLTAEGRRYYRMFRWKARFADALRFLRDWRK